jgi:hypothetical protein
MFGIHYLKTSPTQYVLHYQNGRIQHQGTGQAFFYYKPSSTLVIVPVGSADVPFIFNEATADFQPITVQGQLTYRIQDPELVASLLNYTVAGATDEYVTDDPDKLAQRLVNLVQVATRAEVQKRPLRQAIQASDEIVAEVLQAVTDAPALSALGVEILTFSILAIKPNPETTRALEAEARENLLRQADNAIYDRRNSAVEQERRIKENELNTELAVEEKKQQIREAQVEADLAVERKQQEIREAQLEGQIKLENERKQFVTARVENAQAEADVQAYAVAASLKPLQELDEDVLQLLAMQSAEPRLLVTQALKELAQNASKIGQLNISPDLLESLMQQK